MDNRIYLIKIGELTLKKGNRAYFEKRLAANIRKKLSPCRAKVIIKNGRFYLTDTDASEEHIFRVLSSSFGIIGFTRAIVTKKKIEAVIAAAVKAALEAYADKPFTTFKIEARRADKQFPLSSYEIACRAGDAVRTALPGIKVDVKKPHLSIGIELRESAYIYGAMHPGPGGLPAGSAGRGILLLSGGIDSPVAGYLMAKRGLSLDAIYFHAYPYTSTEALDKVKTLASLLAPFTVGLRLHVIPFTEAQLHLKKHGKAKELTLYMRAAMVETANLLAKRRKAKALVTGEALSQVASQTIDSIAFTGSFSINPIFRPLIGMDKEEIIRIARKIGTFETSILPYEDCCTIFSPEHPEVHPKLEKSREAYFELEMQEELQRAFREREVFSFLPSGGEDSPEDA
jgi:tRNA uracil 4-sulfurtransferase